MPITNLTDLDLAFPVIVFFCGLAQIVLLHPFFFQRLARQTSTAELCERLRLHRGLALVFLWVGGLWSLQNLFLL